MLQPVSHPTALIRNGGPFVETELLHRDGSEPVRVSTIERAFVDIPERPRITGGWPDIIELTGRIPMLDLDRVVSYVERLDNATTAAKVGWILERHQEQFGVDGAMLSRIRAPSPAWPALSLAVRAPERALHQSLEFGSTADCIARGRCAPASHGIEVDEPACGVRRSEAHADAITHAEVLRRLHDTPFHGGVNTRA